MYYAVYLIGLTIAWYHKLSHLYPDEYYTSVPIVLYTIYMKFLHENYYLTIRRALRLIKNICNHSAVFDVRLDTVLKAPKDNGVYCD
jgi:hypothetical protein